MPAAVIRQTVRVVGHRGAATTEAAPAFGGLAHPFGTDIFHAVAPPLSRFVRQGGGLTIRDFATVIFSLLNHKRTILCNCAFLET